MNFDVAAFMATFPAFMSVSAVTVEAWVNLILASPQADWFTNATPADQQLMVAHVGHLLTQASDSTSGGAPGGAVTSASQGSVSASFAAPPIKTGLQYYLSSSPYGRMLWANLCVSMAGGAYVGGLPERRAFRKVGGTFC